MVPRRVGLAGVLLAALAVGVLAWTGSTVRSAHRAVVGRTVRIAPGGASARRAAAASAYGRSPVAFEQNRGQVAAAVRYFARGDGYALGLTERGPELVLQHSAAGHGAPGQRASGQASGREAVLRSAFVGGAADPRLTASRRQLGRVNYLIGRRPADWRTGIRTFQQVTYRDVWPGISVAFHGNQRTLEYDYRLAPGADPGRIGVRFTGARSVRIDDRGDLVLAVAGGSVRELAPRAYQLVRGVRRPVRSRFVLGRHGVVRVAVGRYDRSRELVIDPSLAYSTYLGGNGFDRGSGIAVDSTGDAYVVGATSSTNFPTSNSGSLAGDYDAFLTKLTPTGAIAYSTYLGGSDGDGADAVALDSNGDIFITGGTSSTDFPITANAAQTTNHGGYEDAFVTKLTPAGTIAYSTYLGGTGSDDGAAIAVDASGEAYITGDTSSTDFPVTSGAARASYGGANYDAFVTKLTPSGQVDFSTYLGGNSEDDGTGIAVDGAGNVYVAGDTESKNFPISSGALQPTKGSTINAFVTKLTASGAIGYSTFWGRTDTYGSAIAVNSAGYAYTIGEENDGDENEQIEDGFLLELTPAGALQSNFVIGGSDDAAAIALDSSGNVYIAGATSSSDFGASSTAVQPKYAGGEDGYVLESIKGTTMVAYHSYLGGKSYDVARSIALDSAGNIYVSGGTTSTNFPTTTGAAQTANAGGEEDGFVTKVDLKRSTAVALSCTPSPVTVEVGSSCTATVTDTDKGTVSTPTGTIAFTRSGSGQFRSGSTGTCNLVAAHTAGTARCQLTYTPSAAGTATLRATYSADNTHDGSTITTKLTVEAGPRTTGTAIACVPAAPVVGVTTTCTATVADTDTGTPSVPAGTISFTRSGPGAFPGDKATGSCTLAAATTGVASCQTTYTPSGTATSTIRATYGGQPGQAGSNLTTKLTATARSTSTTLTCAPNPLSAGTAAVCAATISDTAAGTKSTPTGTVVYNRAGDGAFPGDSASATCSLIPTGATGKASCTIKFTPSAAGTDTIRATYTPDSTHATSTQTFKITAGPS